MNLRQLSAMIAGAVLLSIPALGEPSAACREFFEKNCKGKSHHDCRETLKDKIPAECRPPKGEHHGGPPRLEKCADAQKKCEGMERGPEHLKCLEKNGSAECKAEVAEIKKRFEGHRKGN